jgi:hypothetical protein
MVLNRWRYTSTANLLDAQLIKSGVHTVTHVTEGGPRHGTERKSVARSNGLRKFVVTNMIRAKLDFVTRKMLIGHNCGLDKFYYRPGKDELVCEYLKVLDSITIDDEDSLKIKVEELTEKSKDNEYIIRGKLEEKDKQIQNLIEKQEEMEKKFQMIFAKIDTGRLS